MRINPDVIISAGVVRRPACHDLGGGRDRDHAHGAVVSIQHSTTHALARITAAPSEVIPIPSKMRRATVEACDRNHRLIAKHRVGFQGQAGHFLRI